jgi:hypothetical protein
MRGTYAVISRVYLPARGGDFSLMSSIVAKASSWVYALVELIRVGGVIKQRA